MSAPAGILIVEDERIVAMDLQQTLQSLGYDAYAVASSAEEAVAKATARCPDLVLMDIRIQGDRDGIETASLLRERFVVPVVFLTAHADDATLSRAKATVPHGYLLKPVRSAELKSAIEVALYRHEIEKRMRERERWFSTTLRSIGDAVITVDLSGRVTFMNRAAEALTGRPIAEALGRQAHDVLQLQAVDPAQRAVPSLERALRDRETVESGESSLVSEDRGPRIIADTAAPVVDEGELLGAVMVFRDVTEQKQIQQRLELADRLSSLGTMAAGIAHEINNPLAIAVAHVSLLAAEVTRLQEQLLSRSLSTAEVEDVLRNAAQAQGEVLAATTRIQHIVADLKAFSRPELQPPGEADVARAIEWARRATSLELAERGQLVIVPLAAPLFAGIDELRLGQVLVNLILNAAQAMPAGQARSNRVTLAASARADGRIVIEVVDTGHGIAPDILARIFEPFFTTKPPGVGTGLGLSICHGIIKQAGGEIQVESSPGAGALFRVIVPAAARPVVAAREPELPRRRGRVLLVDDEEPIRNVLSRFLEREHEVRCASNGREALDAIDGAGDFDAIICDVMMPVMTGVELYEQLLDHKPDLASRIIFVSGGLTGKFSAFRRSIKNTFLDKPFSPSTLQEALLRVLWRSAPQT